MERVNTKRIQIGGKNQMQGNCGSFKSPRSLRFASPADSLSLLASPLHDSPPVWFLRCFCKKHFTWQLWALQCCASHAALAGCKCWAAGPWCVQPHTFPTEGEVCLHIQGSFTWSTAPLWLFQWLFSPLILCTEGEVFWVTLPKLTELCSTRFKDQWV